MDKFLRVLAYALAIFTGAFLLFQVQPILGKYILPWFGGGPGVWTACLLFFQIALLAGYVYAHLLASRFRFRTQSMVHCGVIVAALLFLPVAPAETWKPLGPDAPTWRILALLASSVGLPYLVLASTGPLLQRWLTVTHAGVRPWRFYALSNVASLAALLTYPFLVEPGMTRRQQVVGWSFGFAAYAVLVWITALAVWRLPEATARPVSPTGEEQGAGEHTPGKGQQFFWFALPLCGSVMLLATTNKICQDIAVVPFLWILPLAAYLLSFVIAFDSPRWYGRVPYTLLLVAALTGMCWALFHGTDVSIKTLVVVYVAGVFVCCTVLHAEAYRLRPQPRFLTRFYLAIAGGGAAGGVFVALAAPMLFDSFYELHWALFLCGFLYLLLCARRWDRSASERNPFASGDAEPAEAMPWRGWKWLGCVLPWVAFVGLDFMLRHLANSGGIGSKQLLLWLRIGMWSLAVLLTASWVMRGMHKRFVYWRFLTCIWLAVGLAVLGAMLWKQAWTRDPDIVYRHRNFYGTLTLYEHQKEDPFSRYLLLQHGGITHGIQFVDRDQSDWATTYYGEGSGLAKALAVLPPHARRIGAVGLGSGTIAAHAEPGDYLRFYEINPEIEQVAMKRFKFLSQCKGIAEVVLGDARLSMEGDLPQEFDLLVLDAFNGDAIPAHLLTREAFVIYDRHLKENGIVAVHISNHYLDLEPVVTNLAREFRFAVARIDYDASDEWWQYASLWLLLCRDAGLLERPAINDVSTPMESKIKNVPLWTDDFTSIYQIVK